MKTEFDLNGLPQISANTDKLNDKRESLQVKSFGLSSKIEAERVCCAGFTDSIRFQEDF